MTRAEATIAELRSIRTAPRITGILEARRRELAEYCPHPALEIKNGTCTLCLINFKEAAKSQAAPISTNGSELGK